MGLIEVVPIASLGMLISAVLFGLQFRCTVLLFSLSIHRTVLLHSVVWFIDFRGAVSRTPRWEVGPKGYKSLEPSKHCLVAGYQGRVLFFFSISMAVKCIGDPIMLRNKFVLRREFSRMSVAGGRW